MEEKRNLPMQKILGVGCVVTILFTILGGIVTPTIFVVTMLFSSEYQSAPPGAMGLLVFGAIPFFLAGAVGGAVFGVVASSVIALLIWLRSKNSLA